MSNNFAIKLKRNTQYRKKWIQKYVSKIKLRCKEEMLNLKKNLECRIPDKIKIRDEHNVVESLLIDYNEINNILDEKVFKYFEFKKSEP